jgi:4-amino-4-deoxy-L-arabinose transferase-like glycosyltransferase
VSGDGTEAARLPARRSDARSSAALAVLARPAVHVPLLLALGGVFCLVRVASQPLDGDPAMYATIARTIARTGEWTHLTCNGDPYLNKPPLHFWLNALVFRLLGATTWTATLVPGLLGVVDVALLYVLCRITLHDWRAAFAAAIVYLTTPEVIHWSRGVHLETLVTFWVLLGVAAAFRSVERPAATALVGIAAVGGLLAKGPQGLFPAALALVLWARDGLLRERLWSRYALVGVAVALVAVGPWLWARTVEGTGFAQAYFGGQIGHALFGARVRGRGPLWYLVKIVRTYWPWLPVAAVGLMMLGREWRRSLGARTWVAYAAIVFVVISFTAGRRGRYLFQLYPAFAAAAGVALAAASERVPRLLHWLVVPAVVAALAVAWVGERVSKTQAAHSREALEIAHALDGGDDVVLITRATQWGEPQFGKILGFYSRPLLYACRATCVEEAGAGRRIVTRTDELDGVVDALVTAGLLERGAAGDAIGLRTPSLALLRLPSTRAAR